jgi:glycosyltransferase involved in cell wall biosynthesis
METDFAQNPVMLVSVLIPSLNEEEGIKKTIISIPKGRLYSMGYGLEIIVVDGNSSDGTRQVAVEMGAQVIVERRMGYGRAYKTGLKAAKGDIIVSLDADGTYPAEQIPDFIKELNENGLDFITVNRFKKVEDGAMSFAHWVGNNLLSYTMRLLYSIDVKDSQSGMWIMKKTFVNKINLHSDDMSMSEEIKIIAFRFFNSLEVDGCYFRRSGEAKLSTLRHGWHNMRYLFQYKKLINSSLSLPKRVEEEPAQK